MVVSKYKLRKNVNAPLGNARRSGLVTYKKYVQGQEVLGFVYEKGVDGSGLVIVDNKYPIKSEDLEKIEEVSVNGQPVKKDEVKTDSIPNSILTEEFKKQLEEMKNTDIVSSIVKKSRNSVNGMLVGAGIGFFAALFLKRSMFLFTVLGATVGGVIGNKIPAGKKKVVEEKKETETVAEAAPAEAPKTN
jgi:hypothetical protein